MAHKGYCLSIIWSFLGLYYQIIWHYLHHTKLALMQLKIYGIKNCDTMKKSFMLLDEAKIAYSFIDYKKTIPQPDLIKSWINMQPLHLLINKQGTTYKKLTPEQQALLENENSAIDIICQFPSVIKRPIVEWKNQLIVGKLALEAALKIHLS
jgi:Spx/MgsR family transcriptional regulator